MLKGKTAVVTGSNRGVGRAVLGRFAREGAELFACARARTDAFEADIAALGSETGVSITPVYFDLADPAQVGAGVRSIIDRKKPIDILVNNAGIAVGGLFGMTPMSVLHQQFDVNFFSPMLLIQGISRHMSRQRRGSIVNVASTAGVRADPGGTAYGTSKAALIHATRILAAELGSLGIRVNAVAPGMVRTDMLEQMDAKARESLLNATALRRVAEPDEVANAILFLASDLASFISGQVLRVDGGMA
jgi:3-oxoacyl-[acyl-carrier protein] reductase